MICIIDYEAGNITSVKRALDHLGIACTISGDPAVVLRSPRIIFPGVGNAESAMKTLRNRKLDEALHATFDAGTPILGICLGAQIVLSSSEEGNTPCLGLVNGQTRRFSLSDPRLKVPHMGWDSLTIRSTHPVLEGIGSDDQFYFVHSYYPAPHDSRAVLATCRYEIEFAAVIGQKNLIAVQFHPEKSGAAGLRLLRRFNSWNGSEGASC